MKRAKEDTAKEDIAVGSVVGLPRDEFGAIDMRRELRLKRDPEARPIVVVRAPGAAFTPKRSPG